MDPLSAAFAALADPTRRAILARLALGDTSVGELVSPFPISAPAISRHLRVLEDARLIDRAVDAQWRICKLQPAGLQAANDWLAPYREFWEQRLDRLVEVLEQGNAPADPSAVSPPGGAAAAPRPARMPSAHHKRTGPPDPARKPRRKP